MTSYIIVSSIITFFLLFPFLKVMLSRLRPELKPAKINRHYNFACIITAYRNANIAKPLIHSLLRQHYRNQHIYLVADDCDLSDFQLQHEQLTVLRPANPLNLKAKSIIYAMERFIRPHEYVVVFDADNLAHPDFLQELNRYTAAGYTAIQGQRTAKNLDTMYACADALGEFYKNYVERYVPYLLNSSAVISGSGMAVETDLYKAYLNSPEIQQGQHLWKRMLQEDKILQNFLLARNERIAYAWDAIVYDEKVTTAEAVETQRSRWLFSYFQNIPNSSGLLWKGVKNFSWNQLLFGLITIAPPLFILLFVAFVLAVIGLLIHPLMSAILVLATAIFAATIFWSLYLSNVPPQIWQAVWNMPHFIWRQVKALFKMSNPNKNFKHTEHNRTVEIDDVLDRITGLKD